MDKVKVERKYTDNVFFVLQPWSLLRNNISQNAEIAKKSASARKTEIPSIKRDSLNPIYQSNVMPGKLLYPITSSTDWMAFIEERLGGWEVGREVGLREIHKRRWTGLEQ